MNRLSEAPEVFGMGWKVPYLHIDPVDIGRKFERLIRINSQSGKGGVAWVLKQDYGIDVPKEIQPVLGLAVQKYRVNLWHVKLVRRKCIRFLRTILLNQMVLMVF